MPSYARLFALIYYFVLLAELRTFTGLLRHFSLFSFEAGRITEVAQENHQSCLDRAYKQPALLDLALLLLRLEGLAVGTYNFSITFTLMD